MKKYKLKDIAKINANSITKKNNMNEIKYLDISSLTNNIVESFQKFDITIDKLPSRAKRLIKENTILYSTVRPDQKHFGIMKDIDFSNILVSTGYATIDVDGSIANSDYVYYYITQKKQINKMQVIAEQSTTAYPSITTEDIKNIDIELPDIENQIDIGKLLYSIDKKINLNNKINDNLEKQMKLLYEIFMLKAENKKINGSFVTAKDLVEVLTGKEDANFSIQNGKFNFFTCSNEILKCNEYKYDSSSILIAGNGDFNVKHYTGKFNAYQRTYILTPQKDYYALLYLASLYRIESFKSKSTGSIVKFITKEDIENIPLFIPKNKSIINILNKMIILKENNFSENEILIKLRDFLLPLLMNGQATISE